MAATFDSSKHPRGHHSNRGSFSERSRDEDAVSFNSGSWPAIGHEPQEWRSSAASFGIEGGRALLSETQQYESAVPATIADLVPSLSSDVAALAEDASYELSRFDAELGGEVAAFGSILLRSEAVASSQIENLSASARAILTAELGDTTAANARVIAANTKAMQSAISLADSLTPDSVRAMHAVLLEHDPRHTPGHWRQEPVWIGVSSASPVGAIYVAPSFDRVPELMDDVMAFASRDDVPILSQAAIAHAQLETIHPFTDGNGRTGRSLIQAMLRGKGLTRSVTVPVSAGLLVNVADYHSALTSYRNGDIEPIVSLTAKASMQAVGNARLLVSDIRKTRLSWNDRVRARSDSAVWKVMDMAARQPVLSANAVAVELGIIPANAYRYLRQLADAGILKSKSEYKIGVLWRADDILSAIDSFAGRTGRRSSA